MHYIHINTHIIFMPRGCQKTNETVNDTATQQVPDKYPTSTRQAQSSPHHPKQKYLLTEKGKERLEREDGKLFTK